MPLSVVSAAGVRPMHCGWEWHDLLALPGPHHLSLYTSRGCQSSDRALIFGIFSLVWHESLHQENPHNRTNGNGGEIVIIRIWRSTATRERSASISTRSASRRGKTKEQTRNYLSDCTARSRWQDR